MIHQKYILDGKELVPATLMEWASWFETANRIVAKDNVGEARISTVFLGVDHQWGDGPPLFFETLVFGGALDQEMDRYSTWQEAEDGHAATVARVKQAQPEAAP